MSMCTCICVYMRACVCVCITKDVGLASVVTVKFHRRDNAVSLTVKMMLLVETGS